jgi:hypothetical protein
MLSGTACDKPASWEAQVATPHNHRLCQECNIAHTQRVRPADHPTDMNTLSTTHSNSHRLQQALAVLGSLRHATEQNRRNTQTRRSVQSLTSTGIAWAIATPRHPQPSVPCHTAAGHQQTQQVVLYTPRAASTPLPSPAPTPSPPHLANSAGYRTGQLAHDLPYSVCLTAQPKGQQLPLIGRSHPQSFPSHQQLSNWAWVPGKVAAPRAGYGNPQLARPEA